jgi:hypothetical protein
MPFGIEIRKEIETEKTKPTKANPPRTKSVTAALGVVR